MGLGASISVSTDTPNSPIPQNSSSMPSPSDLETLIPNNPTPPLMDSEKEQSEVKSEDPGEEEEEEGECGFCLFMKGGGCRDSFVAWEDCIKEAEDQKDDVVERCAQITGILRQCMEAHKDYYAPLLQAEKDMEEQAKKELQEEANNNDLQVEVEGEANNVTQQVEEEANNAASAN